MPIHFYWNCLAFLVALAATPAHAITFATGSGADSASCGALTSPCRTLKQPVTNTPAGGYVVLQGPADFGPAASIDKSLSIVGENGATIRANNVGDGPFPITIVEQSNANLVVRLRGLTIEGNGVGRQAVTWVSGVRLEIADCTIRDFSDYGIFAQPYVGPTTRGLVSIVNSVVDHAGAGVFLYMGGSYLSLSAYIDNLRTDGNQNGIRLSSAQRPVRAVVKNSAVTRSVAGLFSMLGGAPPGSGVYAVNTVVSDSTSGIRSGIGDNGGVSLRHSAITGNNVANLDPALAYSFGDNVIRGNADDTLSRFSSQPLH